MIEFQKAQMALNEAAVAVNTAHEEKSEVLDRMDEDDDLTTSSDEFRSAYACKARAKAKLVKAACNFARECRRITGKPAR